MFKNIKTVLKTLKADSDASPQLISTLQKAEQLNNEEKSLKSEIRKKEERLHLDTKKTIENLTDGQARILLHQKWAKPVLDGIASLSETMLEKFSEDVEAAANKYSVTMNDLEAEIHKTEKELCDMLGDLTGSESDMQGIRELRILLGGSEDE